MIKLEHTSSGHERRSWRVAGGGWLMDGPFCLTRREAVWQWFLAQREARHWVGVLCVLSGLILAWPLSVGRYCALCFCLTCYVTLITHRK